VPFLSVPSVQYKTSYLDAIREFQAEGHYLHWEVDVLATNFDCFVEELTRKATHPAPERVPESIFWLIADDEQTYIGRVSLRHALNEALKIIGGHIGYDIRPSLRRQGYGSLICKLVLNEARILGLGRVMLTCDEDNTASRKIIEANGGQLDSRAIVDGTPILRYWIDLQAPTR
jgi:predicted acetyltransferase